MLEAITVCVNYSDLLQITLNENLKHLDKVIVITTENDKDTQRVCQETQSNKVVVIRTDAFYHKGAKFNKGLAINTAWRFLEHKEWVITLDSDICLPLNFRNEFERNAINIEYAYGARRYDIPTRKDWGDLCSGAKNKNDFLLFRGHSYGYFFAFHYQSKIFQKTLAENSGLAYPFWFENASESDWIFTANWGQMVYNPPLSKFPECHYESHRDTTTGQLRELPLQLYHLGLVGRSHNGRVTQQF